MKPNSISRQRIIGEIKNMTKQKFTHIEAGPLEDDLYTWHFTFQGPQNTVFHEGIYHGQILLPYQYPFKPPDIIFMNKNGRFEQNTKICLTITQYHPEEWNSAWTIRTMLEAVISLFAENVEGVGSETATPELRQILAKKSHSFICEKCGPIKNRLAPRPPKSFNPPEILKSQQLSMHNQPQKINPIVEKTVSQNFNAPTNQKHHQQNFSTKGVHNLKIEQKKEFLAQNQRKKRERSELNSKVETKIGEREQQLENASQSQGTEIVEIINQNPYINKMPKNIGSIAKKIKINSIIVQNIFTNAKWVQN